MKVAVLIPCYNEAVTIAKVVQDFRRELPEATIYVYDNNSLDDTRDIALANGAVVKLEPKQGKGNVVRSMLRDIEADYYVLVDGDSTYPAESVHALLEPVINGVADMSVGDRHSDGSYSQENKRPFHDFGNQLVANIINWLFGARLKDIMSGYRAYNRRFVKNLPILSKGFEIETEMSLHALDKHFSIVEVPIEYKDRPDGSSSKLNTYRDGFRVLKAIFLIFKDYKPLIFFSCLSGLFFLLGLLIGAPVVWEFVLTSYITKVPSAVLAVGVMIFAMVLLACGIILDTVVTQHRETYELWVTRYTEKAPREKVGV